MKFPLSLPCMAALGVTLLCCSCVKGLIIESRQPVLRSAAVGTDEFEKVIVNTVKMPWTEGNYVETLVNGDQIFPSMLSDIRSASKSITF